MPKRSRKYEIGLTERLKDTRYAVEYLNAAAADSDESLLLALRDVAEARKGFSRLSADAHVNRENLYRMLSKAGNPRYYSFRSVARALGLKFLFAEDRGTEPLLKRKILKGAGIGENYAVIQASSYKQLAFNFEMSMGGGIGIGVVTSNAPPLRAAPNTLQPASLPDAVLTTILSEAQQRAERTVKQVPELGEVPAVNSELLVALESANQAPSHIWP
jgi:probable addiction module antidote protein